MSFPETIKYLESFINYEKIAAYPYKESLKLERIREFLSAIGSPQKSLKAIHVAGSKGKGSTCAFISYILREAGYKVGLYTSPHLSDFRERIRILSFKSQVSGFKCFEGMISKLDLSRLVSKLKPAIEEYNKSSQYGPLSFFEVYTAVAFVYFKEKKVDFVVLETGLGGRLDATNVVDPLACAITPISYEHTQKLGNTLREIASEKAGIIKSFKFQVSGFKLPVVTAPQKEEAMKVIRNKCKETGAKLLVADKRIFEEDPDLKINLLGEHQLINASVAVGVIEALRGYGISIGVNSIRSGLFNTVWPGRCEVISKNPQIVLDGAQNIASAGVLKETIKKYFNYNKLILVLGISNDKDIKGICSKLNSLADRVIVTKANNPRAAMPIDLAKNFSNKKILLSDSVKEAVKLAITQAKNNDLILITGSLFVVGEARELYA
ncbi:MAG: bifunctional folylpolyglutamate synthase/dihydrofolate synthase [Candidatus Omnitrophica bacterium]|nr:bifunctional folylpolyglutamate synthase/dihydrofolate synthase [Candidatus Omnitrophota bacterium]